MSRHRTSPIVSTVWFVVPSLLIIAVVWWFFAELRPIDTGNKEPVYVTIVPKTGFRGIAQQLDDAKLVRNRYMFELIVLLAGLSKDLKAGTYELSPSMSSTAIAKALTKQAAPVEVTLTIPEGWTNVQIGSYLETRGIGTVEEFMSATNATDSRTILPDDQFDFLSDKPSTATLQGYLFPDTYRVYPNATPTDVIKKMLDNFRVKVTANLRSQISAQGRTLFDVLTLASIVEREARTDADRRMVADIFWRRIAMDMPLQSDATVNYVTGKSLLRPSGTDLETDSLYNTYKYKGLPPGPIGNPGVASITAVVNPTANSYLFFLTDASGVAHYAATYEEHLANVQRYLE